MNENVESLILEHLRHIRAQVDSLREVQSEHGRRLLTIESGIASLRREQAGDAETVVNVQAQIDRLREEIERIKRRLELTPLAPRPALRDRLLAGPEALIRPPGP